MRAIARQLGYRSPKQAARAAEAAASVCLLHIARHGHTVNRDHQGFIADSIEGLGQVSKQAGLSLEVATFKHTPIEEIIQRAQEQPAAGLVVLGTELSESDVQAFSVIRRPLVFLDTYREEAFVASLARCGLPFEPRFLFATDATFHGAYEGMTAILRRGAELPTALFCGNDIIACGCLKALADVGVRVPEDLSLVGFDDLPLGGVSDPPLSNGRACACWPSDRPRDRPPGEQRCGWESARPDEPACRGASDRNASCRAAIRRVRWLPTPNGATHQEWPVPGLPRSGAHILCVPVGAKRLGGGARCERPSGAIWIAW